MALGATTVSMQALWCWAKAACGAAGRSMEGLSGGPGGGLAQQKPLKWRAPQGRGSPEAVYSLGIHDGVQLSSPWRGLDPWSVACFTEGRVGHLLH